MSHKIPRRPDAKVSGLTKQEMDALVWHVLFSDPVEDCYIRFVHPEMSANTKVAKDYAKMFFSSASAVEFEKAYKKTLADLWKTKQEAERRSIKQANESEEDFKVRRKRESVEKIISKISTMVDDVDDADALLDTIKAMKDTGYFDSDAQMMPPRRYLPETCDTCQYKEFVETNIKLGNIIDDGIQQEGID